MFSTHTLRVAEHVDKLPHEWVKLPFNSSHGNALNDVHKVELIPTLIVLDNANGRVLDRQGYFSALVLQKEVRVIKMFCVWLWLASIQ